MGIDRCLQLPDGSAQRAGSVCSDCYGSRDHQGPEKVKLIKTEGRKSYVAIAIHEGKNRQVRRMFEAVGHKVLSLRRVKVGNISLKGMEKGQIRPLTDDEVAYLKRICQL